MERMFETEGMAVVDNLDPVRALLADLAKDDYVRFKYGKRVDAALKALAQAKGGPDGAALEARLLELLEIVRGKPARGGKKGAGAVAPGAKSAGRAPQASKAPHGAP
jgi:hypothetical protein